MLRKRMNLSQSSLSYRIISESHLSNIEKGRYTPHEDILKLLSPRLNVPESYLVNYKIEDMKLEDILGQFYELIETNVTKAKDYYEDIKKNYAYIPSIKQEFQFLLLIIYMFYKTDVGEADRLFEKLKCYFLNVDINRMDPVVKGLFVNVQALHHFYKKDYLSSNQCYYLLLDISSALPPIKRANILHNIALNYWKIKDFNNAEIFCRSSLEIYYKEHDWGSIGDLYNFIAVLYCSRAENEKAITQLEKIFQLPYTDMKTVGKTYHNLGTIYLKSKDYCKALEYLNKAVEIKEKSSDITSYVNSLLVLIKVYINLENLSEVELLFSKIKEKVSNKRDHYRIMSLEAKVHFQRGITHEYEELMIESINFFIEEKMFDYIISLSQ
ncbi:helix-turn-helix domain-containing protein [Rossellomorea sp. NPDC077527]|uniref:helix-turn-helix domain-containing protein n=1 Tax=Rossellomorea sp. NPDC077527 TaxID=3364510 RepID=UPI0037C700F2